MVAKKRKRPSWDRSGRARGGWRKEPCPACRATKCRATNSLACSMRVARADPAFEGWHELLNPAYYLPNDDIGLGYAETTAERWRAQGIEVARMPDGRFRFRSESEMQLFKSILMLVHDTARVREALYFELRAVREDVLDRHTAFWAIEQRIKEWQALRKVGMSWRQIAKLPPVGVRCNCRKERAHVHPPMLKGEHLQWCVTQQKKP